jgi:outer membrane protein TolC
MCGQDNGSVRLTLSQARDHALENNRTVQSSRIDLNIANQKIKENLASGLPQISVDANYLHQFTVPEVSFGPFFDVQSLPTGIVTGDEIRNAFTEGPKIPLGVKNNTVIDFTLSQLVFNGQYFVALKTARIVREMSEKTVVRAEDQVRKDVEVSYYSILVLQENIRLLQETERSLSQMYDEVSGMNRQGLNEETDVDQVNVNRSNVQALMTTLESQIEIAYKQFKFLLGLDFEQEVELTDSLNGFINESNLVYLNESGFNLENNIDYQIVNIQEDINEQLLRLEKSRYLPTLSAFYRHQEQTNQPSFNFAVKDVIGANFSLPIYSGGLRSSKVNQAKYDLQKTRLNKQNTVQGLTMEYETARNNYQAAYRTFNINRESMELSRKIYNKTLIKFREGVSSSFELTQMQNQFINSESNYYNSLLELLKSKAELDRILRIDY